MTPGSYEWAAFGGGGLEGYDGWLKAFLKSEKPKE
jgi:hypothetical protein